MSSFNEGARLLTVREQIERSRNEEDLVAAATVGVGVDLLPAAVSLQAFLTRVAALVRGGLPETVWIEATVAAVKQVSRGHTVELVDASPGLNPAQLRVFLSDTTCAAIFKRFGLRIDPMLLLGMTTVIEVQPRFDPTWHLGGRVVGLTRSAETSLRRRLLEQAEAALKRERLWDRQRRLPAPGDVTRVAVIHPPGSAGWADLGTKLTRWQAAGLLAVRSCPVRFEGAGAAKGLIAALDDARNGTIASASPDLILLVRGGGAKASLVVFDDPDLARAVCLCPVPVMTGVGHAVDIGLVDRVAWRSAATPSLAVTAVGSLIAVAARIAAADHAAILAAAERRVAASRQGVTTALQHIQWAAHRRCAEALTALAARCTDVRVGASRARAQLDRLEAGCGTLLLSVLAVAPSAVKRLERACGRALVDGLDRASRVARRHDDGIHQLGAIGHAAASRIDRQGSIVDATIDGVFRDAHRRLAEADTDLVHLNALLDTSDVEATLKRGFVVVTDADGRFLPTRAGAAGAARLSLIFADGMLNAIPMTAPAGS